MEGLKVHLNGDRCWPDLSKKEMIIELSTFQIAGLQSGMQSGAPSVSIRIDLDESTVVIAQTSLALLLTACDGLKARYGDPRLGGK